MKLNLQQQVRLKIINIIIMKFMELMSDVDGQ